MKFNDEANKLGICQDARSLVGLNVNDTVSYPISDLVRNANSWYRLVNSWIWNVTGTWEYDDSNYTNLPIATTDLVDGQDNYELPTTAQRIDRIEILDQNGDSILLKAIDKSQVGYAMPEFEDEEGTPIYYDLVGRSIILYPTPATGKVTLSDGLKVYFTRGIKEFATTDTSTEPGFDNNFHRILSYGMALDYSISHMMADDASIAKVNQLKSNISSLKEEVEKFYGVRHRDMKPNIHPRVDSGV